MNNKSGIDFLNLNFLAVVISILVAVLLIFPNIGQRSFWLDEADLANVITTSFSEIFSKIVSDAHPLAYTYLLKTWSLVFGNNEAVLRSFSALFALLTIPLMYSAGKFLFNSSGAGRLAAFLTGTNYFLIFYATQNRPYTFLAWLSIGSFYYFISWVRSDRSSLPYIIFTILGLYTHSWFFLIFGAQGLIWLIFYRNKKAIPIFTIIGILSIPIALIYLHQGQMGVGDWIGKVSPKAIFESIDTLTYGQTWNYVVISLTAFFLRPKHFNNYWLFIYLLAPLILALIISQFKPFYYVGRYEMVVLPAMLLLLVGWWEKVTSKVWVFVIICSLLFFSAYYNVKEEQKLIASYKTSDRKTTQLILDKLQLNDKVVATGLSYSTFYYYSKNNNTKYDLYTFPPEVNEHPGWIINSGDEQWQAKKKEEAKQLIDKLTEPPIRNIWVILSARYEPNNYLLEFLDEKFELVQEIISEEPHQTTSMNKILLLKLK